MRRFVVLFVVLAAIVLAACDSPYTDIPGAGPLRYRDEVFTTTNTTKDVVYGTAVDQTGATVTLLLDVYQPAGDTVTARPTIVWVHGGAFRSGSNTDSIVVNEAKTFARMGYVTVSINYRLVSGGCANQYGLPACIQAMIDAQHDAQAAVRFVRANAGLYGVDATRIGIKGYSAGAITALHVGFNSDEPGTGGNPEFSSAVRAAVSVAGAKRLGTANTGDAPTLLLHGTLDTIIPYQWAVDTQAEAKAAGLSSYLTTFVGAGHSPTVDHAVEIYNQTRNFFYWEMELYAAAQ